MQSDQDVFSKLPVRRLTELYKQFHFIKQNTERKKFMKKTPDFKTEQEEREFWETHDSTDYVDWSKASLAVLPNLKPTTVVQ